MPSPTPERWSQLLLQCRADQAQRWQRGERVRVEDYLEQYPELPADTEGLLALIIAEVRLRCEAGEQPLLDEYLGRFSPHADALRRAWPQLLALLTPTQPASDPDCATVSLARGVTPSPPPSPPPLVLPGLELHEKLGEGGMGIVFRARDVRLDQPRAIKVIRRGPFFSDEAHDRFQREAKAVARLNHPGVVRIFALGEHEGTLYICMEFLEGGSLQSRLRQGPLEVRAAADLVRRLALAVQHAHDNRVLHRDLKPGNVLLSADGTPKIADFGLAKLLDVADDLTHSGYVLGTPSYMAPEQAAGQAGAVREATDVWSLGAILYECLCGRPPFKGETRSETLLQVQHQPVVPPRRVRADVPAGLEAICLHCLEKDPGRRYATATALAEDLQRWLDGKPLSVTPRSARRRLWLAASGALVLLALLASVWIAWPTPNKPPDTEPGPVVEPPPAPDVWHPLLTREPLHLIWPEWDKTGIHRYEPDKREFQLSCKSVALFALGETTAPRYQVAVTLEQHPWIGNIGLFFGFREETVEGRWKQTYQTLALSAVGTGASQPLRMDWQQMSHTNPALRELRTERTITTSANPIRPSPQEHRLMVSIGPGGLEEVKWDEDVLSGLSAAEAARRKTKLPAPEDYRGRFGIYVDRGNGVFSQANYLFREEPP
jgi:serine/threonine protein kinase